MFLLREENGVKGLFVLRWGGNIGNTTISYTGLEMEEECTDFPFRLVNTDEVSIVLEPAGERAKLVVYATRNGESVKFGEKAVDLDTALVELERKAYELAQFSTSAISDSPDLLMEPGSGLW